MISNNQTCRFVPPQEWSAQVSVGKPFRIPNEFYPTPPEATRALLSVEQFDGVSSHTRFWNSTTAR